MHELKNEPEEWIRRKLYYNSILEVLKNPNFDREQTENTESFVNYVKKNAPRDRKQTHIEDLASQVLLLCEKRTQD